MVAGFRGWIFYLDADAFVYDRNFDLAGYLDGYSDKALIASLGGTEPEHSWDINTGVFLINLKHEKGRQLIEDWHADIMGTSDERLASAKKLMPTDAKKALVQARVAAALEPSSPEVWIVVAQGYEETGDNTKAAEAFKRVISLDAGNTTATEGLKRVTDGS
jgi:hypothetical protein